MYLRQRKAENPRVQIQWELRYKHSFRSFEVRNKMPVLIRALHKNKWGSFLRETKCTSKRWLRRKRGYPVWQEAFTDITQEWFQKRQWKIWGSIARYRLEWYWFEVYQRAITITRESQGICFPGQLKERDLKANETKG